MKKSINTIRKKGFRYVRFVILAVSVLFLSFVQASVLAFNSAYVVMSNQRTSPLYPQYQLQSTNQSAGTQQLATASPDVSFDWAPSYLPHSLQRYPFDAVQRSFAFAGSFAGSLLGTYPMLYLLRRFGAHTTMFIVGAICTALCALTPLTISISFELFVALRVVSGFITAPLFPVMGSIIEGWAAMNEKGIFIAFLSAQIEIAPLFTLFVGSVVAEKINWPAVFYIHAGICAFFTLSWLLFYRNDPFNHPLITIGELEKIREGKSATSTTTASTPYRSILTTKSVWAVLTSSMGCIFVSQFMSVFSPQYYTAVLGNSPSLTGTLTLIPMISQLPVKFVTGAVSDGLRRISEIIKLRLFNSLACFFAATFFVLAIVIPPAMNAVAATAFIMAPFVFLGFTAGGFHKATVLISGHHASFLFSIVHICAQLALIIGTFGVPLITPDNTFEQWRTVFIVFVAVLVISNVIFIVFVKAEPEKWAEPKVNKDGIHPTRRRTPENTAEAFIHVT